MRILNNLNKDTQSECISKSSLELLFLNHSNLQLYSHVCILFHVFLLIIFVLFCENYYLLYIYICIN